MKKINIKKGAIALAFITTIAFTTPGCGASIDDITYETNANGYIESIEGTISYDFLEHCYFAKVTNNVTDETYYTISLVNDYGPTIKYYDIFTKQNLHNVDAFDVECYDNITVWLNALNMTKSEYTEVELRELLNIYIEKQEKDKQLVKE